MDATTLSTTFTTIVGLIINFKNERHSNDIQELINWLNDNGQSRYVEIINQNTDLTVEMLSCGLEVNDPAATMLRMQDWANFVYRIE